MRGQLLGSWPALKRREPRTCHAIPCSAPGMLTRGGRRAAEDSAVAALLGEAGGDVVIPMLILLACRGTSLDSWLHADDDPPSCPLSGTRVCTCAQQWRTAEAAQQLLHVRPVHAGCLELAQLLRYGSPVLRGPRSLPRPRLRQQLGQRPTIARRRSGRFGAAASAQAVSTTSGLGWEQRRSLTAYRGNLLHSRLSSRRQVLLRLSV